jgi:hypothetical protein
MGSCLSISDEGHEFLCKRSKRDVDVSDDMQRQSIIGKDDGEKCQIG